MIVLFELFVTNLLLFEHQQKQNKKTACSLNSWQFSGPHGITKYDSGWRKDVINLRLESGYHPEQKGTIKHKRPLFLKVACEWTPSQVPPSSEVTLACCSRARVGRLVGRGQPPTPHALEQPAKVAAPLPHQPPTPMPLNNQLKWLPPPHPPPTQMILLTGLKGS